MFPKIVGFSPKSSISIGFSIINHPFWGTTIFGNTYICQAHYTTIPTTSCNLQVTLPSFPCPPPTHPKSAPRAVRLQVTWSKLLAERPSINHLPCVIYLFNKHKYAKNTPILQQNAKKHVRFFVFWNLGGPSPPKIHFQGSRYLLSNLANVGLLHYRFFT